MRRSRHEHPLLPYETPHAAWTQGPGRQHMPQPRPVFPIDVLFICDEILSKPRACNGPSNAAPEAAMLFGESGSEVAQAGTHLGPSAVEDAARSGDSTKPQAVPAFGPVHLSSHQRGLHAPQSCSRRHATCSLAAGGKVGAGISKRPAAVLLSLLIALFSIAGILSQKVTRCVQRLMLHLSQGRQSSSQDFTPAYETAGPNKQLILE